MNVKNFLKINKNKRKERKRKEVYCMTKKYYVIKLDNQSPVLVFEKKSMLKKWLDDHKDEKFIVVKGNELTVRIVEKISI